MLSLFLLAVLAFAVDYTNIWFQRQQMQTAADAACQAGAMDVYQIGQWSRRCRTWVSFSALPVIAMPMVPKRSNHVLVCQ
jgi:uncharacterized membrane protein